MPLNIGSFLAPRESRVAATGPRSAVAKSRQRVQEAGPGSNKGREKKNLDVGLEIRSRPCHPAAVRDCGVNLRDRSSSIAV